jgi:hypothetical protein
MRKVEREKTNFMEDSAWNSRGYGWAKRVPGHMIDRHYPAGISWCPFGSTRARKSITERAELQTASPKVVGKGQTADWVLFAGMHCRRGCLLLATVICARPCLPILMRRDRVTKAQELQPKTDTRQNWPWAKPKSFRYHLVSIHAASAVVDVSRATLRNVF